MSDPGRHRRCSLCLALLSLAAAGGARGQQLRARRVVISAAEIRAEGDVRLRLGECQLQAHGLELGAGGTLEAEQPCLAGGRLRLRAHRLRRNAGGRIDLDWLRAELCRCGDRPALRVDARAAWRSAGGRRLHLRWPILRLGRMPLLVAPYWAVPLRPGVSGLLFPEVAFSERDGLRLEQAGYLAAKRGDLALGGGWVQRRGVRLRSRLRYHGQGGDGELALGLLHDRGRWRGQARGTMVFRRGGWAVGLAPDATSDQRLLSDIALDPARVFAPYLRSRLWTAAAAGPLSGFALGDLFHRLEPSRRRRAVFGRGNARIDLAPSSLAGPLLVMGRARLLAGDRGALPAERSVALLELSPAATLAGAAGPFRLEAHGRYLLQLAWIGAARQPLVQGAVLGAEASLPLARRFDRHRHTVEPFVGWWAALGAPRWTETGRRWAVREGGLGLAGLRTRLAGADGPALLRGQVRAAFAVDGDHLLGGSLRAGRMLRLEGAVWSIPSGNRLVELRADLCSVRRGLRLCAGWRRHRFDALWQLAGQAGWEAQEALYGVTYGGPLVDWAVSSLALTAGPLQGRVALAVDTAGGEMSHAVYGAELPLACGCLRLGFEGRSRTGQRWPDLALRISLAPGAGIGCLLR